MTKSIENTLGLRSLEEALKAFGAQPTGEGTDIVEATEESSFDLDDLGDDDEIDERLALAVSRDRHDELVEGLLNGSKTEKDLDDIQGQFLRHAETLIELALELDPGRAPRAFEVANAFLKHGMDAITSKRDYQLKTMKMLQDQKKLELEERKLNGKSDTPPDGVIQAHATVISSADMLRSLQSEYKEINKEPPPQGNL